jgi:hypothetical protein
MAPADDNASRSANAHVGQLRISKKWNCLWEEGEAHWRRQWLLPKCLLLLKSKCCEQVYSGQFFSGRLSSRRRSYRAAYKHRRHRSPGDMDTTQNVLICRWNWLAYKFKDYECMRFWLIHIFARVLRVEFFPLFGNEVTLLTTVLIYVECKSMSNFITWIEDQTKTNSVALSPRANYTDWSTANE